MPWCTSSRGRRFWREPVYYRRYSKRNPEYERKASDYIKVNDKLKMLGILFTAGFRASQNKGLNQKRLRIYLYEDKKDHDYYDESRYARMYLEVFMNGIYFRDSGKIRTYKQSKRGKRKSQIVKV
jgi:predicted HTH transcriptional regulator